MKTLKALLLMLALMVAGLFQAKATLLMYEPFNIGPDPTTGAYTVGTIIGQNPTTQPLPSFVLGAWALNSGANGNAVIQAGSAPYADLRLAVSGGSLGAADNQRIGRNFNTPFTTSTVGTYYMSFLASWGWSTAQTSPGNTGYRSVEMHTSASLNDNQRTFRVGFSQYGDFGQTNTPTGNAVSFGFGLENGVNGTGLAVTNFGVTNGVMNGLFQLPSFNNTVHLYVFKFVKGGAAGADNVVLWIDPDLTDTSVEPAAAGVNFGGLSNTTWIADSISPGPARLGSAPGVTDFFDELRIGTVYSDVVPKPTPGIATWTQPNTTGNWSVAANWLSNSIPSGISTLVPATFGNDSYGGVVNGPSTVTIDAGMDALSGAVVDSIIFANLDNPATNYTIVSTGGRTLSLNGSGNIQANNNATIQEINAPITTGGAATSVNKVGGGTVKLSGVNTFTVPLNISAGTVQATTIGNSANNGSIGTGNNSGVSANQQFLVLSGGGTLQYVGSGDSGDRLFQLGAGNGILDASGTGPWAIGIAGTVGFPGGDSTYAIGFADTGAHTLVLQGSNTGTNTVGMGVQNNASGALTSLGKLGTGTWVLDSAYNTATGTASITNGTLVVKDPATYAFAQTVIDTNGMLDFSQSTLALTNQFRGNGVIVGPATLTSGGLILIGNTNNYGQLSITNTLVNNAGSEVAFDVAPTLTNSDYLIVSNMTFGGNISVTPFPYGLWTTGNRIIGTVFSGADSSSSTVVDKMGSRFNFFLGNVNGTNIQLTIFGGAPHTLVWNGLGLNNGTNWNSVDTSLNWDDTAGSVASRFLNPDNIILNDAGLGSPTITLINTLFPHSVTVSNSTLGTYTLRGGGGISGVGGFLKLGLGTINLNETGVDDYAGGTVITNGTVVLGANDRIPAGPGKGDLLLNAPGILNIATFRANVNGLTGTGTIAGSSGNITVLNKGGTNEFDGYIANPITLIVTNGGVAGNNSLTLTGTNTYNGPTRIMGSLLAINSLADSGPNALGLSSDLAVGIQMQAYPTLNNTLRYYGTSNVNTIRGLNFLTSANGGTNFLEVSNNVTMTLVGVVNGAISGVNQASHKIGQGTIVYTGISNNTTNAIVVDQGTITLAKTNGGATVAASGFLTGRSGTLIQLGGNGGNQIDNSALVQIDAGATLDMKGLSEQIGGGGTAGFLPNNGLQGGGLVENTTAGTTSTLTLGSAGALTAFTGSIADGAPTAKIAVTWTGSFTDNGSNNYSGNTTISGGTFTVGNTNAINGDVGYGNLNLTGGTLDVHGFNVTANALNGGGTLNDSASGVTNKVTIISLVNTTNVFSGVIQNTGGGGTRLGVTKIGPGTTTLSGISTFTGDLVISNGTVQLTNTGAIVAAQNVNVTAGAILDAASTTNLIGTFNSTFLLEANSTLKGYGTVKGNVFAGAGSTISPGGSIGTLTVNGNVYAGGTNIMELDRSQSPSNDVLVATAIQPILVGAGSYLVVTNIGTPMNLVAGDTFQFFQPKLANKFANVSLPALSAGLVWLDTTTIDGKYTVANASNTGTGPFLTLSWPTGSLGFLLQEQTNSLSVGLSNNWATIPGSDQVTSMQLPITKTVGATFFRLIAP